MCTKTRPSPYKTSASSYQKQSATATTLRQPPRQSMRYAHHDLIHYAHTLLATAGLEHDKAAAVADILVQGDLMGHNTHGLALLPGYLAELESGAMEKLGTPTTLADHPAAVTWD